MPPIDLIAFDADDTLWDNERLYHSAQARFAQLLAHYHAPEWISERLYATEMRNLRHYGYGIKAFALSMIETAVELTEGRISGQDIQRVIELARHMLEADVQLLDGVRETVALLAASHRLIVVTKGDLLDQETKIARSGLGDHFHEVEVVSHKTRARYGRLLARYAVAPERFLMVGNSLRSDIWPPLELGAHAAYIPYDMTWAHEAAEPPAPGHPGFHQLAHIGELPALLARIEGR